MTAHAAVVRARVLAEARRFRAMLPELMAEHAERWIVFHEGRVVSTHDTEEEAYVAGLTTPGPEAGHVVAVVRAPEAVVVDSLTTLGF